MIDSGEKIWGLGQDKGVLGEEGKDRKACIPKRPDNIFWYGL